MDFEYREIHEKTWKNAKTNYIAHLGNSFILTSPSSSRLEASFSSASIRSNRSCTFSASGAVPETICFTSFSFVLAAFLASKHFGQPPGKSLKKKKLKNKACLQRGKRKKHPLFTCLLQEVWCIAIAYDLLWCTADANPGRSALLCLLRFLDLLCRGLLEFANLLVDQVGQVWR